VLIGALLTRLRLPALLGVVGLGIVLSAGFKVMGYGTLVSVNRLYFGTDARADALLIGGVVAVLLASGRVPQTPSVGRLSGGLVALSVAAGLLWVIVVPDARLTDWYLYRGGGLTLVALAAAVLLVHLLTAPHRAVQWLLTIPPLVAIGRISYGLYLWHNPVSFALSDLGLPAAWHGLFAFTITILIAVASYRLIERPLLHRRAVPRRAAAGPALGTEHVVSQERASVS
jgi:peptidoglycan/LPS O-acetylase OafA/YrhL